MLIKLFRQSPMGDAVYGTLVVDNAHLLMDTLEHQQYAIPTGFYRLRLTYSPSFQEVLPLLDRVIGYARDPHSGAPRRDIRIHAGNGIEHTTGGILVGEKSLCPFSLKRERHRLLSSRPRLQLLRDYLLTYHRDNPTEEVYIQITEPDPYPDADEPCPLELQQHVIDAYRAEQQYYEMFPEERYVAEKVIGE